MFARPLVETTIRATSSHPKERNDCVVIATALAFGIPYDEAFDLMGLYGRTAGKGTPRDTSQKAWISLYVKCKKRVVKHSFPAVKGKKRMNVLEFCKTHSVGTFITKQAGHMATVIDGKVHDVAPFAWWHWERCVYTAFQILPI